ncbi:MULTISPECIES: ATP-binding protein [unclassified Herbaspirillum]|uniref:ATP-binding protein n=1 Tax=unclassified Herbaspirillum TaxID=2624150 RepID=UPI00114E2B40|nr:MULTISPECIES: ATP-binding protein [unclassified Herbaspirillum]MBB5393653.1 signal transduction histidine kinase [Herbaspirillum sp. SJZ102]TQK03601.1 signal transduction histidine kinase [Herbaspirillum sp. SJZ130]TQK08333.1 signal transduction histidine kinase [Herbaspirillum sp. SJZ106]
MAAPEARCACPPRARSLSLRLLGVTAIVLALAGAAVVGTIAAVLRWGPELVMNRALETNVKRVIDGLRFDADGRPYKVILGNRMETAYEVLRKDCVYRVLDEHGAVLLASDGAPSAYTLPGGVFEPGRQRLNLAQDGEKLQVITQAFEHQGRPMYVQVMRSERLQRIALDNNTQRVRSLTVIAAIVGMALFSLVVVITLHYLLKPLRQAAAAAADIHPDNLSTRLSLEGVPRELAPLFGAFNLALDRVEEGYRRQREFLATAAHELKTPLALMRGQIELGDLGDRRMLLQDIDQMARHVHQLLHLAEACEPHNYAMVDTHPADVLAQACAQLARLAQQRQVHIVSAAAGSGEPIRADAGALSVLVKNLLENAICHSEPGGIVSVHADRSSLSVRDEGPGIAPEAMPHLFERFWRGPHRRDEGAGLGLSICAEIAKTHGWRLEAGNAHPGAIFELRFQPEATTTMTITATTPSAAPSMSDAGAAPHPALGRTGGPLPP